MSPQLVAYIQSIEYPPRKAGKSAGRLPEQDKSCEALATQLVRQLRPQVILEIGNAAGAYSIPASRCATGLGLALCALCVCDWTEPVHALAALAPAHLSKSHRQPGALPLYEAFLERRAAFQCDAALVPIHGNDLAWAEVLLQWGVDVDLCFAHANGDLVLSRERIRRAGRLVRAGGLLVVRGAERDVAWVTDFAMQGGWVLQRPGGLCLLARPAPR